MEFHQVLTETEFGSPFDIAIDDNGRYAYVTVLFPREFVSGGTTQVTWNMLPRFPPGTPVGTLYWVQYTPFARPFKFDSRLPDNAVTIPQPVIDGPFRLGESGPMRYISSNRGDKIA